MTLRLFVTTLLIASGLLGIWVLIGSPEQGYAVEDAARTDAEKEKNKNQPFASSSHPTLTFLYTIGNNGYIEPCG